MQKTKQKTNVKVGHLNHQIILRDKRTGELTDYGDAEIRTEERYRNKGFVMIWPRIKSQIFELNFLFFLIRAMESNYIIMTDEQLAKKFETTRQRIGRVKQKLKKDKIIKYAPGIIFVNPDFIFRGNAYKREEITHAYYRFKPEEDGK